MPAGVVPAVGFDLDMTLVAHAGLTADLVVGDIWAEQKSVPLLAYGAVAYVGDHLGDVTADLTVLPGLVADLAAG